MAFKPVLKQTPSSSPRTPRVISFQNSLRDDFEAVFSPGKRTPSFGSPQPKKQRVSLADDGTRVDPEYVEELESALGQRDIRIKALIAELTDSAQQLETCKQQLAFTKLLDSEEKKKEEETLSDYSLTKMEAKNNEIFELKRKLQAEKEKSKQLQLKVDHLERDLEAEKKKKEEKKPDVSASTQTFFENKINELQNALSQLQEKQQSNITKQPVLAVLSDDDTLHRLTKELEAYQQKESAWELTASKLRCLEESQASYKQLQLKADDLMHTIDIHEQTIKTQQDKINSLQNITERVNEWERLIYPGIFNGIYTVEDLKKYIATILAQSEKSKIKYEESCNKWKMMKRNYLNLKKQLEAQRAETAAKEEEIAKIKSQKFFDNNSYVDSSDYLVLHLRERPPLSPAALQFEPSNNIEVSKLKEQLAGLEKTVKRVREQAHEKCRWFRKVCYQITGWRIDFKSENNNNVFELYSTLSANNDQYLRVVQNEKFDLLHTPFIETLNKEWVERTLNKGGIPLLLSTLTVKFVKP